MQENPTTASAEKRTCEGCGIEFEPSNPARSGASEQRFHSTKCQRAAWARAERRKNGPPPIAGPRLCVGFKDPGVPCNTIFTPLPGRPKKFCTKRCQARSDYLAHRGERIEYQRKRRKQIPDEERKAADAAYYARNRERMKANAKASYHRNGKAHHKARYWRQRGELAEARRILAAQRKPAAARAPGRPQDETTNARITLAAFLMLGGATPYAMKGELFPKQHVAAAAFDSTKKLLTRRSEQIEAEKQRLYSLPESNRSVVADSARQLLKK